MKDVEGMRKLKQERMKGKKEFKSNFSDLVQFLGPLQRFWSREPVSKLKKEETQLQQS